MRLIIAIAALAILSAPAEAQRSTRTKGYVKKSTGTYVAPSRKTTPDRSRANNYTAKGNVNPYNGKKGRVDPYAPSKAKSKKR